MCVQNSHFFTQRLYNLSHRGHLHRSADTVSDGDKGNGCLRRHSPVTVLNALK